MAKVLPTNSVEEIGKRKGYYFTASGKLEKGGNPISSREAKKEAIAKINKNDNYKLLKETAASKTSNATLLKTLLKNFLYKKGVVTEINYQGVPTLVVYGLSSSLNRSLKRVLDKALQDLTGVKQIVWGDTGDVLMASNLKTSTFEEPKDSYYYGYGERCAEHVRRVIAFYLLSKGNDPVLGKFFESDENKGKIMVSSVGHFIAIDFPEIGNSELHDEIVDFVQGVIISSGYKVKKGSNKILEQQTEEIMASVSGVDELEEADETERDDEDSEDSDDDDSEREDYRHDFLRQYGRD